MHTVPVVPTAARRALYADTRAFCQMGQRLSSALTFLLFQCVHMFNSAKLCSHKAFIVACVHQLATCNVSQGAKSKACSRPQTGWQLDRVLLCSCSVVCRRRADGNSRAARHTASNGSSSSDQQRTRRQQQQKEEGLTPAAWRHWQHRSSSSSSRGAAEV